VAPHEVVFVVVIRGVEVHPVGFGDLPYLVLAAGEPDESRVELLDVLLHLGRAVPAGVHGDEHGLQDRPGFPAFVQSIDHHGDLVELIRADVRAEGEAEVKQRPAVLEVCIRVRLPVLVNLCGGSSGISGSGTGGGTGGGTGARREAGLSAAASCGRITSGKKVKCGGGKRRSSECGPGQTARQAQPCRHRGTCPRPGESPYI
jgi:hypothetical protein